MATTSSTLATGKTSAGSGGHHGRRTAGLLATAALGLSLLVGGTIMHERQAAAPVAAPASAPALTVAPRAPLSRDQLLYDGSHPGFVEYLPGAGPSAPPAPPCDPSGACLVP